MGEISPHPIGKPMDQVLYASAVLRTFGQCVPLEPGYECQVVWVSAEGWNTPAVYLSL